MSVTPFAPSSSSPRYMRQLPLPGLGLEGQERLRKSRVLVVGCGGLGSPVALYLAAAGVGHLTLLDPDKVQESNLNRQILHGEADIGRLKCDSAVEAVHALNSGAGASAVNGCIDLSETSRNLIEDHDFVCECSDNFACKYLVSDLCSTVRVPCCIGGVEGLRGQLTTWSWGHATLRDLLGPEPPRSEAPLPILGATAGVVGSLMAAEAVKFLTGIGPTLLDRLLTVDLATMEFENLGLAE